MTFEEAYEAMIEFHLKRRQGERKARLLRNRPGEKLTLKNMWWPVFGNLDYIHPEYEVIDYFGRSRFIDNAFLPPYGLMLGLESDGYEFHAQNMTREQFCYERNRDTFLTGLGWRILHFANDDLRHRPEICRQLLRHVMSGFMAFARTDVRFEEKEVLRLACRMNGSVRPIDVQRHLKVNYRKTMIILNNLCGAGMLRPVRNGGQVRRYELLGDILKYLH